MYKIDDKLCRNSEFDRRSVLSVPKTVQSKLNRDEILHIFITYGEQHAIPSQLIVNLVHVIKKLHLSPIIQVDADVVSPLVFAKGTGHFGSRGVRGGWAGHGDLTPLAK